MSKIGFVAFLYLIGVGFTAIGAIDNYFTLEFWFAGRLGTMSSDDPNVARVARVTPGSSMIGAVVYTTPTGIVKVPNKRLGADTVRRLANGEAIPVKFLGRDPDLALLDGAEPKLRFGTLIGGCIALAVAIFAHRLLRREAGVA